MKRGRSGTSREIKLPQGVQRVEFDGVVLYFLSQWIWKCPHRRADNYWKPLPWEAMCNLCAKDGGSWTSIPRRWWCKDWQRHPDGGYPLRMNKLIL